MSEERSKRRGRRKGDDAVDSAPEAQEQPADDAVSPEEGPVAPQSGFQDEPGEGAASGESEPSDEGASPEEGPVAPQSGVKDDARADAATAAPARRRRGSAETSGARRRTPRKQAEADVVVRAQARYVRCAPRKARLVVGHIRGKRVEEARAILRHTPRGAARDVLKLLESCVSNAENNHELAADELVVQQAFVDEGPTIRRYRPRAYGRATRINKRTSHMTLTLTPTAAKE